MDRQMGGQIGADYNMSDFLQFYFITVGVYFGTMIAYGV